MTYSQKTLEELKAVNEGLLNWQVSELKLGAFLKGMQLEADSEQRRAIAKSASLIHKKFRKTLKQLEVLTESLITQTQDFQNDAPIQFELAQVQKNEPATDDSDTQDLPTSVSNAGATRDNQPTKGTKGKNKL